MTRSLARTNGVRPLRTMLHVVRGFVLPSASHLSSFSLLDPAMPRARRLDYSGAIWHLISRGNDRREIYRDDDDRYKFMTLLADVVIQHRWRLYAYVLMPNHYHLLAETPDPTLSAGMKSLNERYAEWFNWRHSRVGHLMQGRFKSIPPERPAHLVELLRYIVLNPVRCGIVADPGEWKWSSYPATAGIVPAPHWLDTKWVLQHFDGSVNLYREFVHEGSREWPQVCLDAIAREVAWEFREPDAINRHSPLLCRTAFAQLAAEETRLNCREIGDYLSVTRWPAARLIRAGRERELSDPEYRKKVMRIRARTNGV